MNRTKSQLARLLELDRRIRAGEYPNCLSFSADWEVSQKTAQRDIDYLRDQLGAPIEYDRERKGFYYTDRSWFLPALSLSEGDLFKLLVASRALEQYEGTPVARDLERIYSRIAELMPERISVRPELVFSRFSFTTPPAKPVSEKAWVAVVRGLQNQRTVRIRYRPFDAAQSVKPKWSRINPYHVANLQGEWYVFAVHAGHTDVRQFSMARIDDAALTDQAFDVPSDFDAHALLAGAFGRYAGGGKALRVRLLFSADIAEWITERQWHAGQKLKRLKNGDIELSFPAKGLYEVQRWVLSWGRHVRVRGPLELRRMVEDEIRQMAHAL